MNFANAMLIFRKDWREISRNSQIIAPIVVIPFVFSIILPSIIILMPSVVGMPGTPFAGMGAIFENLPVDIKAAIDGMSAIQQITYIFALYFFAPFFLIIPIMSSSVIASDSFAGEKDRKTIEALLATPLTDGELLLGKILVAFIPSMAVTILAFAVYCAVVDLAAFSLFSGAILLPNALWMGLIFMVTPLVALAGIGITVMVSLRVKGYREAQQLSAILILPVLALIFGQIGGVLMFGPTMIMLLVVAFVVVDIILFRIGVRIFRREEILMKSI